MSPQPTPRPIIAWFRQKVQDYAIDPHDMRSVFAECPDLDDIETVADHLEMFGYPELAAELNDTLTP